MTEAGWTRATDVNQAGWYWLRRVGSLAVVEVIAVPGYEPKHWIVEGVNLRWSLGNMDGEFLGPLTPDSFQQGRVASLVAMKDYLETRADIVEGAALRELLAGNSVKESNERSALAEIHAMQSVIRDLEAQQAQGGVGDANG